MGLGAPYGYFRSIGAMLGSALWFVALVGVFHAIRDPAVAQLAKPARCHRRASAVSAEALSTEIVVGRDPHAGVEVEAEMLGREV